MAGWEKVLNKIMIEVQLPISKSATHQPLWVISHPCSITDVLKDSSTGIEKYKLMLSVYHQSINYSLFAPSIWNCNVYEKVIKKLFPTFQKWWSKIETSKQIEENRPEIIKYTESNKTR